MYARRANGEYGKYSLKYGLFFYSKLFVFKKSNQKCSYYQFYYAHLAL